MRLNAARGGRAVAAGILAASLIAVSSVPARGQGEASLDSLLRANAYPLDVSSAGLSGPGADFLLGLDGLQFVSIGESHNIAEIPLFTTALLRALSARGFRTVAFENGPVIMSMLSEALRAEGPDAAFDLAGRYPHGMQFWTDEEVALALEAPRVWGLDQAWGALHLLERLEALAPTPAARETVAGLIARVRPIESTRAGWGAQERWIDTAEAAEAVQVLRDVFEVPGEPRDAGDAEAGRLIETLALSNRIYRMRGGTGTYRSNALRERTMKRLFMERYDEALAAGDTLPRVIAKFGHWHAGRGRSPGEVYALGNFLSELATGNGMESFHISVALLGDVWTLADYPEYGPLPRIGLEVGGPDGWTLVDLRPLRAHLATGRIPEVSDELRDLAVRFDAQLLIGGARRGTRARLLGFP